MIGLIIGIVMYVCCLAGIVLGVATRNWISVLWIFNTAIWVSIALHAGFAGGF